jgi:hypothetical protein
LYKNPKCEGFGTEVFQSIEKRMMRIMDECLLPAGYELEKVQHDFERFMQGKALFDRGTLDSLATCADNNERYDILSTIREYVIPNYDDLQGIYPELSRGLVEAVHAGWKSETRPVASAFGNLQGRTAEEISSVAVDIFDDLRYLDIERTFRCLADVYKAEQNLDQRKHILQVVENLARYNLNIWRQAGPYVQVVLADVMSQLTLEDRAELHPLALTVWRELLGSELRGTEFSADKVAISTGAVQLTDELKAIREKAINGLIGLYDQSQSYPEKRQVVSALIAATWLPSQGRYSNELCASILDDTKRIVELLSERTSGESYELLEHIEHRLLFDNRRALEIAADPQYRFGCKEIALSLMQSILVFRELVNADEQYVRYKTLVGHEAVLPHHWDNDEFDYWKDQEYRKQRAQEYIEAISDATEDEWYRFIEPCAATKSNDGATFPIFGEYLYRLARAKPAAARRLLERANDDVLNFLPAFLDGLRDSGSNEEYWTVLARFRGEGKHLSSIARHFRHANTVSLDLVKEVLSKAITAGDNIAVIECLVLAIEQSGPEKGSLIEDVFLPAAKYLTAHGDARWVRGAWFLNQSEGFFRSLTGDDAVVALDSLAALPKIDHEAERILFYIAEKHPEAVWKFLGQRIYREREGAEYYEPFPYQFQELKQPLAKNVDFAVDVVRGWFQAEDRLFRFTGGRLLNIVFPIFPEPFAERLSRLVVKGSNDDLRFVLTILVNYRGEAAAHEVLKHLIDRLPEEDPRLSEVEICISNTGVVSGEFGWVEAYRAKKAEMASWIEDNRHRVKKFAEIYIRRLDGMIAAEQRRGEQRQELRKRDFETDGED